MDNLDLLLDAYSVLGWTRNQWPERHSPSGQALLIRLRDAIAQSTGDSAQDIQDSCDGNAIALLRRFEWE